VGKIALGVEHSKYAAEYSPMFSEQTFIGQILLKKTFYYYNLPTIVKMLQILKFPHLRNLI